MDNPRDLRGDELLAAYREALVACHGRERADKSSLSHERGWYHIYEVAEIGSWQWSAPAYSRREVVELTESLLRRAARDEVDDGT